MDLSDKCILLSGAGGVLGPAFAEVLARANARLVLCGRNIDQHQRLAERLIKDHGIDVIAARVDLTDEHSVKALSKNLCENNFIPDVLVNNAATGAKKFFQSTEKYTLEDWETVMRVNVTGAFLMIREFLPSLIKSGKGNIINVASIYGVVGPDPRIYEGSFDEKIGQSFPSPMVYAASKGALIAMTRHIATFYGDKNVRANTLVPGGVLAQQNEIFIEKYSNKVPLKRMAHREEVANALLFLSSDKSSYINGQTLIVDGGYTSW